MQQELVYLKSSNSTKSLLNNDTVFDTNQVYYIKLNELQNHININDIRNAQSAYFDKYDKFLIFNQIKQNMQSNDFSISEVSMFFGQGLKIIPIVFSNKIIQSDKIRLKLYLKKWIKYSTLNKKFAIAIKNFKQFKSKLSKNQIQQDILSNVIPYTQNWLSLIDKIISQWVDSSIANTLTFEEKCNVIKFYMLLHKYSFIPDIHSDSPVTYVRWKISSQEVRNILLANPIYRQFTCLHSLYKQLNIPI